jgi:hypothetical protein
MIAEAASGGREVARAMRTTDRLDQLRARSARYGR